MVTLFQRHPQVVTVFDVSLRECWFEGLELVLCKMRPPHFLQAWTSFLLRFSLAPSCVLPLTVFLLAAAAAAELPTSGLVAYYPFNGNCNDESGNGHHGTVHGPTLTSDRNGNVNSAFAFDGVNDYILLGEPVPEAFQLQHDVTLAAWIYMSVYPPSILGHIVGCQYDGKTAGYSIHVDSRTATDEGQSVPRGHVHFQIGGDGAWHHSNSQSHIPLNTWVHITATRSANNEAKIYYNGILQTSICLSWSGSITYTGARLSIGMQKGMGRYFRGSIDDVTIYSRELNAAEVRSLYSASSGPTPAPTAGSVLPVSPIPTPVASSLPPWSVVLLVLSSVFFAAVLALAYRYYRRRRRRTRHGYRPVKTYVYENGGTAPTVHWTALREDEAADEFEKRVLEETGAEPVAMIEMTERGSGNHIRLTRSTPLEAIVDGIQSLNVHRRREGGTASAREDGESREAE